MESARSPQSNSSDPLQLTNFSYAVAWFASQNQLSASDNALVQSLLKQEGRDNRHLHSIWEAYLILKHQEDLLDSLKVFVKVHKELSETQSRASPQALSRQTNQEEIEIKDSPSNSAEHNRAAALES